MQGPPSPRRPSKAPRTKTLGPKHLLASALISDHPSAPCRVGGSGLLASWGQTLTLGRPPRGPSQGAYHCNAWDWGPPRPSARLYPAALPQPRPLGVLPDIQAGERAGNSEPLATFEGCPRQNTWVHAPAHQRPPLGQHFRSPHSQRIRPASLLGANPNPRSVPKRPGTATPGIGYPRAPALDSTCRPQATRAARVAAGHSGQENGQGPPSHW